MPLKSGKRKEPQALKYLNQQSLINPLEEILAKEKEAKAGLDAREQTKQKDLRDKVNAEEMRLQAMEKIGDTKKEEMVMERWLRVQK